MSTSGDDKKLEKPKKSEKKEIPKKGEKMSKIVVKKMVSLVEEIDLQAKNSPASQIVFKLLRLHFTNAFSKGYVEIIYGFDYARLKTYHSEFDTSAECRSSINFLKAQMKSISLCKNALLEAFTANLSIWNIESAEKVE